MKNNQDKANELFKFLTDLYNSCGGECEECSLKMLYNYIVKCTLVLSKSNNNNS